MSMIIWPTVSLWGGFMSIGTMNFYVLKNSSFSWKQNTKKKKKRKQGFAEKGVRESVQDNDANVYLAISLSELPQKHTAPPWPWCSDNKLIRTQQMKFSSDIVVHPPAKVPTHSSLSNFCSVHNFPVLFKIPFLSPWIFGELKFKVRKIRYFAYVLILLSHQRVLEKWNHSFINSLIYLFWIHSILFSSKESDTVWALGPASWMFSAVIFPAWVVSSLVWSD